MNGTEELAARVRVEYAHDADEVLALLLTYGAAEYEREPARVRSAILDMAKGDRLRVEDLVGSAKLDYRDVLYWHDRI